MLMQYFVGALVSAINIGIHALVTVVAVSIARTAGLRPTGRPGLHLMGVMVATAAVLQIAHTLEVLVWAGAYGVVQAVAIDRSSHQPVVSRVLGTHRRRAIEQARR